MNESKLQEILEEYALRTEGGNDMRLLRQMIDSYPQYAEELEDFAAARAVIRFAPDEEFAPEEEARFAELGMQNLRMFLGEKGSNAVASDAALQSLTDRAKAKGMNKKSFAAALGLSVSMVQYLEKRRLAFASIPQAIIAKVGEVLEAGEEAVAAYLNQSPDTAAQASFKATERAEEMPPKDFAEAVREDQMLSPDEKRKLLEL
jgi:transcriptional regulator with XRE-family HTH domain